MMQLVVQVVAIVGFVLVASREQSGQQASEKNHNVN
jgi:hypothetical protein